MSSRWDELESYARRGWKLLPCYEIQDGKCSCHKGAACKESGKHPRTGNGFYSATDDLIRIRSWVDRWPTCNWAVRTGQESGLVVIDVDAGRGGYDTIEQFEMNRASLLHEDTLTAHTGGGGVHYFFSYPPDTAKVSNAVDFMPGVDIRGDGGYVLVAPSNHLRGTYRWANERNLGPLPRDIIGEIRNRNAGAGRSRLPDSKDILAGVPEGQRDDVLFRFACRMRRVLQNDRAQVTAVILTAAANCEPPFPEADALRKVESAFSQDHTDEDGDPGPDGHRLTPAGNGHRLVNKFGHELIYVANLGWHVYNGVIWENVPVEEVKMKARQIVEDLSALLPGMTNRRAQIATVKHIDRSDSDAGWTAMITAAQSDASIFYRPTDLKVDPLLLPVANGVVRLDNGELLEPARADLITSHSRLAYSPHATAPRWEAFMRWAMCGDEELVEFMQRLAGYSCMGLSVEHIFPVLYGHGRNGKSTFIEVMQTVLGDMCRMPLPTAAITHEQDLKYTAMLFGKRVAVVSESNERAPLNTEVIKSYTGDATLTGKLLYRDPFEFTASHTLWFVTNHKPRIPDNSDGIWSRVLLVPWRAKVQPGAIVKDLAGELMRDEGPGIVRWFVRGAMKWLEDRDLCIPEQLLAVRRRYRENEDLIGVFMRQHVRVADEARCTRAELKVAYQLWCEDNDVPRKDRKGIRDLVESIGERTKINPNARVGAGPRFIQGVGLMEIPSVGESTNQWS